MCLVVMAQIEPDAPARISARRLKRLTGLGIRYSRLDDKPALHFTVSGFCSCEFLAPNAERGDTLDLHPQHRVRLAEAIRIVAAETRKFALLMEWDILRERTRREVQISAQEMVALIESNTVGNTVMYRVTL